MKKTLKPTAENLKYLNDLPKIYLIAYWARFGYMELDYTGKTVYDERMNKFIPLVYQFDDHNGEYEAYHLRRIDYTTTGFIQGWCDNKWLAEKIVDKLNDTERV